MSQTNLLKQNRLEVKELLGRIRLEHPSLRMHAVHAFLNLDLCGLLHSMAVLLSDMPNLLVFSRERLKLCGVKSLQSVDVPVGESMQCSVAVCACACAFDLRV